MKESELSKWLQYSCQKHPDTYSFEWVNPVEPINHTYYFLLDDNHSTGEVAQLISASKNIQNGSSNRFISETTNIVASKNDEANPSSRKSSEFRTPMGDQNKQNRASPCPPPIITPLAVSTPAIVPHRKSSTSSLTTSMENRTHEPRALSGVTPHQDNYSVIPEGDNFE